MTMSNSLLLSRRFAPLFWCQFFAAFNDNFLKNALILLILCSRSAERQGNLLSLWQAPYSSRLISSWRRSAAKIADKFDKALVAQRRALAPREVDDPAVILFTSGSEGAPKGVVRGRNVMLGYLKV